MNIFDRQIVFVLVLITFVFLAVACSAMTDSVPHKIGELYKQQSKVGAVRTYFSPEPPIPTAEKLQKKLGWPEQKSDISMWQQDPTHPIMLVYDEYVVTVEAMSNGSRIEVTDHTTAYSRHHSHFLYYWGPSWAPTVRRGNVNTWGSGPGRVQDGGIGGIGGK